MVGVVHYPPKGNDIQILAHNNTRELLVNHSTVISKLETSNAFLNKRIEILENKCLQLQNTLSMTCHEFDREKVFINEKINGLIKQLETPFYKKIIMFFKKLFHV